MRKKPKQKTKRHGLFYLMKRTRSDSDFTFPDFPDFDEYVVCGNPLPAIEFNSPHEAFSEVFWQNDEKITHGDVVLFLASADDKDGIPIFAVNKKQAAQFEKAGALVLEKNMSEKFSAVAGVYKWPKPGPSNTI